MNDYTRFKVVRFDKEKSDTTAALSALIEEYVTPQKLSVKYIRTNLGDFVREFQ